MASTPALSNRDTHADVLFPTEEGLGVGGVIGG
jgi:hypothetical protein